VIGTLYTAAAIGSLTGPPFAGLLIDQWGYRFGILFSIVMSSIAVGILRIIAVRRSSLDA
jgi:MFS family permease